MTTRSRKTHSLATQTAELAMAVPQVVAHRLTRMATAGLNPSARDRKEFHVMGAEKAAAFMESWAAMYGEMFRLQQQMWLSSMTAMWTPLTAVPLTAKGGRRKTSAQAHAHHEAAMSILHKGLAPVHRRAVANAKRLAKIKL